MRQHEGKLVVVGLGCLEGTKKQYELGSLSINTHICKGLVGIMGIDWLYLMYLLELLMLIMCSSYHHYLHARINKY